MIEVSELSKRYGRVEAVRDVSFQAQSGQIIGLLGPNGAGKSTIMKILTCYHFPSSGEALIAGVSVYDNPKEIKRRIGYLPEYEPTYTDLTIEESLSFAADARGLIPTYKKSASKKF